MARLAVRALTACGRDVVAGWRYPGRYATYDFDDASVLERDHMAVVADGVLVGYCCFGEAARVGGAPELPGTLDVGYGLAPDLMGQGLGSPFVQTILEFASTTFGVRRFRLFILDWNIRSTTVAARAGFVRDTTVETDEGTFLVMVTTAPTGH